VSFVRIGFCDAADLLAEVTGSSPTPGPPVLRILAIYHPARHPRAGRAVMLAGPRQCGKTTLARELLSEKSENFCDLEDPAGLARLLRLGSGQRYTSSSSSAYLRQTPRRTMEISQERRRL
jgi:hypothetical protein